MQKEDSNPTRITDAIIKYQFTQFCKQNTKAIAILLKALLQGAKHYPKSQKIQESISKGREEVSVQSSSTTTQNTRIESNHHSTDSSNKAGNSIAHKSPLKALNLEG